MAIPKYAGVSYGATLKFTYRGPVRRLWVGFGLRYDPYDYYSIPLNHWLGAYVDVSFETEEVVYTVDLAGDFPPGAPTDALVDTWKILARDYPLGALGDRVAFDALVLARDRDDEVYVVPSQVWDISRPESDYR